MFLESAALFYAGSGAPKERGWNKGTILGCRFYLCQDARRAFSGTKKSTSNPESSGTK